MKNYLYLSAVGMMMLAACSNDDTVPLESPDAAQAGSEITLSLVSGGDGINTRANRPVYSSEAANNVKLVKLAVYNSSGADVTSSALGTGLSPLAWNAGPTTPSTPGDVEHKASQSVKLNKLSPDGDYTVVAYGYNTPTDYTFSGGGKGDDAFTATLLTALTPEAELFAGKTTFTVTNGVITSPQNGEVIMKRQVAGVLAYFKNIPILYPDPTLAGVPTAVAFVRLYASSHSNAFTFPSGIAVNGNNSNPGKNKIIEFNLATLLGDFTTQVTNASANLDLTKVFNIATSNISGVQTVPNSVLAGKFLIPFTKVTGATTFTLQLESATGTVLKSWDIVNSVLADKKVYDIQRNYFYSIGQKVKADATDGGTPGGGNTADDDIPIDLSQETIITLTINDAWDMIYNLGIE